jgi:dienelactone hydrolase
VSQKSLSVAAIAAVALVGCASKPLLNDTTETPPLVLAPATQAGIDDKRPRFREVFCTVLEARKNDLPDYRPCDEALRRVGSEPNGNGKPVSLARSERRLVAAVVPGFGYDCFAAWLDVHGTVVDHLRTQGYELAPIRVEGLSSTARNARLVRDAVMTMSAPDAPPRIVLVGYSKGSSDILEALVSYPEIVPRVAAVVSVAGTIGGSPLANDADQSLAELLVHFPRADCTTGDGGAVASLKPDTRKAWLAANRLPSQVRYYSVVAFPRQDRISAILQPSYQRLSLVDPRNDSQVIFYDAVVPASTLVGYLNADHWAVAVPIARSHPTVSAMFVTQNAYPREALAEAILRFVEEDLDTSPGAPRATAPR